MSLSISSSSSNATSHTAWLANTLQANGLSAAKAKTAATDLMDAAQSSLAANPKESDADLRSALNARIDADVKSGTVSQGDADKVKTALDQADGSAAGASGASAAGSAGTAGGASSGGGGGGGSSEKTEVSRTVTVSGSTKTTIITYNDGTSDTTTATATTADHRKYDKGGAAKSVGSDDTQVAQAYLAQTPPGTLVDKAA